MSYLFGFFVGLFIVAIAMLYIEEYGGNDRRKNN